MASLSYQNRRLGHPESHLFRFCAVLKDVCFVVEFWGRQKVVQRSPHSATLAENLIPSGSFLEGLAGEAGCPGGERGGAIENC